MSQALSMHVPPTEALAGAMLGPYRILECIGDGGMGRVYRAEHVELGRPAAIKFLLSYYAADPEAVLRFQQEAKAVNMVRHENLVDIYDVFVEPERGIRAYVMELLSGRSLRDAMVQEALGLRTVLSITRQIASALHAVHGAGIVHRDLKPENIYLCAGAGGEAVVKVLDFGVAKFTRGEVPYQTGSGTVLGSPWYMAPEQARGQPVDHRADVYSLGVLLYEMLTGCVPFPGYSLALVVQGHIAEVPPPLRRRDGWEPPAAISAAVLRCLEKDPAARPPDMAAAWRGLAMAAEPRIAPTPVLVPPLEPAAARTDGSAPEAMAKIADPAAAIGPRPPRSALRRIPIRRLAVLSFALGMAGGLAGLAILVEQERDAQVVAQDSAPPSRQQPHRTEPPPAASKARPSNAAPPLPKRTPRVASATPKRRVETKVSRWSKAAFDQKRARALAGGRR